MISIKHFCNEVFALSMLFKCIKQDGPQRIIFIPQTHSSKGAQKMMLKGWNFTKNSLCKTDFDNNLPKIFQTNVLENGTGQILLIVISMVGVCLDNLLSMVGVCLDKLTDQNLK